MRKNQVLQIELENRLYNYQNDKRDLANRMILIEYYEELLKKDDDELVEETDKPVTIDPSMPKCNVTSNPTEQKVIKGIVRREQIERWLKYEKSKILLLKTEMEIIGSSLKALTQEELFVIECKYFERLNWFTIEQDFNDKFRNRYNNCVGEGGLKKIKARAVTKLNKLLESFYMKVGR